jgi:hypothetical protein
MGNFFAFKQLLPEKTTCHFLIVITDYDCNNIHTHAPLSLVLSRDFLYRSQKEFTEFN